MNALALTALRRIEPVEVPRPEIRQADDVLIRMEAVGVCGSDVHYYTTGRIGDQVVRFPQVVGHEGAGLVVSAGPAVTRLQRGDRVVIEPAVACGACDQCRIGRENTCRHLRFLGCPGQLPGCLSEYLVMPERCCIPVAAGTTAEEAALVEPLAIGLYAVRQAPLPPGACMGILGAGPIGLSVLLCARHAGVAQTMVVEPLDYRRRAAVAMGADGAGSPADAGAMVGAAAPEGLDVVFECCGKQEAVDQGMRLLKPGGTLMMIGIPSTERIGLPVDLGRRHELTFRNVRRQAHCTADALHLLESGAVQAASMITHRFEAGRITEAFEMVAGYREGVIKAMIRL